MSVVVAVKKAGKVVIASDTLYSFGSTKVTPTYISNRSKIHSFGNSYIGIVGASATDNVFRNMFETHKDIISFDDEEMIFKTLLRIHPILKDEYFLNTYDDSEPTYEPSKIEGLVINSKGIFGIYGRREVYAFEKFWAIGSGEEYALGALYSTYDSFETAEQIAESAVKAGCEFDDGCGLPLESYSIELDK